MKMYEVKKQKQLELLEKGTSFQKPAKRINIVSLKLVKESSILYIIEKLHHQMMLTN
ncbi:hypothetical protein [Peribacillus acanthi]|uniref:hypothetical protein n=1 Tax=Peribacillus acanthi TaxID=2171554 RepID=UPI003B8330A0